MKKGGIIFLIPIIIFISLNDFNNTVAQQTKASVLITVKADIPSMPALKSAEVLLLGKGESHYKKYLYTDQNGNALFKDVPLLTQPYDMEITIKCKGFNEQKGKITIESKNTSYTSTFKLIPTEFSIIGYVKDRENKPIPGSIVVVPPGKIFPTDGNGFFTIILPFPPPSSGKIQIKAAHGGYFESEKEIQVNNSSLTFDAGVIILQEKEGTIVGLVISEGGNAIEGAEVSCEGKKTTTSKTGSFSITGVMPGSREIIVKKPYFFDQKKMVTIKGGMENDVGTITLQGFSCVAGYLRAGTTKIEGAEVICRDKKTLTDNEGRFRIDAIPCGQCELIIIKNGYKECKKTLNLPEGKAGYDLGRIELEPIATSTDTTESASQTGKTSLQREQKKQQLVLPNK